ncbi:MAG: hypothetical protein ABIS21_00555 [Acidimicrobiales bacterium]
METADILLIAGALVIALFVGLLFVVLRATAKTAENAKEILLALEDITAKAKAIEQLDGAARSTQRTRSQLPGSSPIGNGSGEGTEVPS